MASALGKASRKRTSAIGSVDDGLASQNQPNMRLEKAAGVDLHDISSEQMLIVFQFALKVGNSTSAFLNIIFVWYLSALG